MASRVTVRYPLLVACIVVTLLYSASLLSLTSIYQTNDDPQMMMSASGVGLSPTPDPHLLFTNIWLGRVLTAAYSYSPTTAWYGFYLLLAQVLSQIALLYVLLINWPDWRALCCYVAYFAVGVLHHAVSLQFTTTAFLSAQSGILLLLAVLDGGVSPSSARRWGCAVGGLCLLGLGASIRFNAALLVALLAIPLIGWWVLQTFNVKRLLTAVVLSGAGLLLCNVISTVDQSAYRRDTEWSTSRRFWGRVSQFVDYKRVHFTDETKPDFDEVQWSQNDFSALMKLVIFDRNVYTTEKLQQILDTAATKPDRQWQDYVATVLVLGWQLLPIPVIFLAMLQWSVYVVGKHLTRADRRVALITLLWSAAAVYAIFLLKNRLPERVSYPVLHFPLVSILVLTAWRIGRTSINANASDSAEELTAIDTTEHDGAAPITQDVSQTVVFSKFTIGLLLLTAFAGWLVEQRDDVDRRHFRQAFGQDLRQLNPSSDQLYFCDVSFPYRTISPWEHPGFLENLNTVFLGPTQRTPLTDAQLSRFGHDNAYQALLQSDNVFLVERSMTHPVVEKFISEHYGIQMHFEVYFTGETIDVYRARVH